MVEQRKISDLADSTVTNTLPDETNDFVTSSINLDPLVTNAPNFTKEVDVLPYADEPERSIAGVIISKQTAGTWSGVAYEVLTSENRLISAYTLNRLDLVIGQPVIVCPIRGNENFYYIQEGEVRRPKTSLARYRITFDTNGTPVVTEEFMTTTPYIRNAARGKTRYDNIKLLANNVISVKYGGLLSIKLVVKAPQIVLASFVQKTGSSGDDTTQCSYTYSIWDANTGKVIDNSVFGSDPTAWGIYQRPNLGPLEAATFGLVKFNKLVPTGGASAQVIWCNETLIVEACP